MEGGHSWVIWGGKSMHLNFIKGANRKSGGGAKTNVSLR